ncbi:MAG: InlB B-repeat-containing protein, partial [Erysipelotrichaceae bacterium]|nr:InlB B-repeat-containing protein [Erysipelotrichaceae bacterium]
MKHNVRSKISKLLLSLAMMITFLPTFTTEVHADSIWTEVEEGKNYTKNVTVTDGKTNAINRVKFYYDRNTDTYQIRGYVFTTNLLKLYPGLNQGDTATFEWRITIDGTEYFDTEETEIATDISHYFSVNAGYGAEINMYVKLDGDDSVEVCYSPEPLHTPTKKYMTSIDLVSKSGQTIPMIADEVTQHLEFRNAFYNAMENNNNNLLSNHYQLYYPASNLDLYIDANPPHTRGTPTNRVDNDEGYNKTDYILKSRGNYSIDVTIQADTDRGWDFAKSGDELVQIPVTIDGVTVPNAQIMAYNPVWHTVDVIIPIPVDDSVKVRSVTINKDSDNVAVYSTMQFTADVITNSTDKTVSWSLSGNTSALTTIDSTGLLTVAAKEQAETLTITASANAKPGVTASTTVNVTGHVSIDAVNVTPKDAGVVVGTTKQFEAEVTGTAPQGVTWSVYGNTSSSTTISSTGLLTVGNDETASSVQVRATSTFDETKHNTVNVEVVPITYITTLEFTLPTKYLTGCPNVTHYNYAYNFMRDVALTSATATAENSNLNSRLWCLHDGIWYDASNNPSDDNPEGLRKADTFDAGNGEYAMRLFIQANFNTSGYDFDEEHLNDIVVKFNGKTVGQAMNYNPYWHGVYVEFPLTVDHAWDEREMTKEPTVTEEGNWRYTCGMCGQTKDEAIPRSYTYDIRYHSNFGKTDKTVMETYVAETVYNLPECMFSRTDYTFSHWNTYANNTGTRYEDKEEFKNLTDIPYAEVDLYAQWAKTKYTVTFNGNGATSGTMKTQSFTYNGEEKALRTNTYKRKGYTFTGWNTKKDGSGTFYEDGAFVKNLTGTGAKTLYAQWSRNTYTVNYEMRCADAYFTDKYITDPAYRMTFEYGDFVSKYTITTADWSLPKPYRKGYTFKGWYTDTKWTTKVTKITKGTTGDKTYYAKWAKNEYTVKFYSNTPGTDVTATQTFKYDTPADLQEYKKMFTYKGYRFVEWNTQKDGSGMPYADQEEILNLAYKSGEVIKLYAQWEIKTYTVTYELRDGWFNEEYKTEYTVEDATWYLPKPEKTGFTFKGWYTDTKWTTKVEKISKGTTGNKTYYARWGASKYTVKFYGNGSTSGTMDPMTCSYGKQYELPENKFKKTGYIFTGWNLAKDG